MRTRGYTRTTAKLALVIGMAAAPALGEEVRLIGKDSNINVVGDLLSTSGGQYLVRTDIGEFYIDQELVTCEGAGCPQMTDVDAEFEIGGDGHVAFALVPVLLEGFAESLEAEVEFLDAQGQPLDMEAFAEAATVGEHAHEIPVRMIDYDGEELGNYAIHEGNSSELLEELADRAGHFGIAVIEGAASRKQRDAVLNGGGGDIRSTEQERVIGMDGHVIIAHPNNGAHSVSLEQAAMVLAGEITNWTDLGGPNAEIAVYSFAEGTSGYYDTEETLMGPFGKTLTPEANIVTTEAQLANAVISDPAGFGFIAFSRIRDARPVPLRTSCGIIQMPSAFTIKTEEYALNERLTLYSRNDISGVAKDFVAYMDSGSVGGLIGKAGWIDLTVEEEPMVENADRLAGELEENDDPYEAAIIEELLTDMNSMGRLSTTFRFAPGSSRLDNRGQRDLELVIDFLTRKDVAVAHVVGFTDNKGPFEPNIQVAQERAEAVLAELQNAAKGRLDGIEMQAEGFGELAPVACNDTPHGRATNRRVEIWVKDN